MNSKPTKAPKNSSLSLRTVMLPRDTNALGSIFGGHILSLIDIAAGQHARSVYPHRYVTKLMREVNFHEPVFVGDLVSFYTHTLLIGTTSITIKVDVEAVRGSDAKQVCSVTSAEVVMVAIDEKLRPTALK